MLCNTEPECPLRAVGRFKAIEANPWRYCCEQHGLMMIAADAIYEPLEPEMTTIPELLTQLDEAESACVGADQEEAIARNRATDCHNKVNSLQKQIDAALHTRRKESPMQSDWRKEQESI